MAHGREATRRGICPTRIGTLLSLLVLASLALPGAARAGEVVAVLPMVVHSDGDRTHLREGLADMLASRLGRQPGIAVMRLEEVALATTQPDEAAKRGKEAGATWVVFGSFTHFGDGASLDVRCVPTDGSASNDPRSVFIQSGTIGDIIPQLDALTEKLGRYVASGGTGPLPDVASGDDRAPAGGGSSSAEVEELRLRVQALEAQVFAPIPAEDDLARGPEVGEATETP